MLARLHVQAFGVLSPKAQVVLRRYPRFARKGPRERARYGLRAVRVGEAPTHAAVAVCLAVAAVVLLLGSHDTPNPIVWRRVALAGVLGLATAWLSWQALRKNEAATALGLMAWRFLAALAAI